MKNFVFWVEKKWKKGTLVTHFIWVWFVSGGSGSADFAILIFPAGDAVWDSIPAVLWLDGKLDSLSHQHPLCGIQNQKGKRESWFQKPCHSGLDQYYSPFLLSYHCSIFLIHFPHGVLTLSCVFLSKVVWSSWWAAWQTLEERGVGFQLHFSSVWIRDSTHSLCQASPSLPPYPPPTTTLSLSLSFSVSCFFFTHHIFFSFLYNKQRSEAFSATGHVVCCSNIYYINDNLDKRTWTYIFGACCATTVFIPSFHNYRIWSFLGLIMTTYTAWYLTVASLLHGQVLYIYLIQPNIQNIWY